MKTTVELSDTLFHAAKRTAAARKTTIKALIEQGLRAVIAGEKRQAFKLREASFNGNGLVAGRSLHDWDAIRDAIYSGRGE